MKETKTQQDETMVQSAKDIHEVTQSTKNKETQHLQKEAHSVVQK